MSICNEGTIVRVTSGPPALLQFTNRAGFGGMAAAIFCLVYFMGVVRKRGDFVFSKARAHSTAPMKGMLQLLAVLILNSCQQDKAAESFFDVCSETVINLATGIEVSDSLGYCSFRIPDSTWRPKRYFNANENGVVVGDSSLGYDRFFGVFQSTYSDPWDKEAELMRIEQEFNVIEAGEIRLNGSMLPYHIVHFENDIPPMLSMYIVAKDESEKRHYVLNTSIEFAEDYETRLCTMKPIIASFTINN